MLGVGERQPNKPALFWTPAIMCIVSTLALLGVGDTVDSPDTGTTENQLNVVCHSSRAMTKYSTGGLKRLFKAAQGMTL